MLVCDPPPPPAGTAPGGSLVLRLHILGCVHAAHAGTRVNSHAGSWILCGCHPRRASPSNSAGRRHGNSIHAAGHRLAATHSGSWLLGGVYAAGARREPSSSQSDRADLGRARHGGPRHTDRGDRDEGRTRCYFSCSRLAARRIRRLGGFWHVTSGHGPIHGGVGRVCLGTGKSRERRTSSHGRGPGVPSEPGCTLRVQPLFGQRAFALRIQCAHGWQREVCRSDPKPYTDPGTVPTDGGVCAVPGARCPNCFPGGGVSGRDHPS